MAQEEKEANPDGAIGKMSPQFELLAFLLGGRSAEEVVADARAKLDESAKNSAKGLVLATEAIRSPSGAVTGRVEPVWMTPWERDRQAIDAAIERLDAAQSSNRAKSPSRRP